MHGKTHIFFKQESVRGRVLPKPTEHAPSQNEKWWCGDSVRVRGSSKPTNRVSSQNEKEEGLATISTASSHTPPRTMHTYSAGASVRWLPRAAGIRMYRTLIKLIKTSIDFDRWGERQATPARGRDQKSIVFELIWLRKISILSAGASARQVPRPTGIENVSIFNWNHDEKYRVWLPGPALGDSASGREPKKC